MQFDPIGRLSAVFGGTRCWLFNVGRQVDLSVATYGLLYDVLQLTPGRKRKKEGTEMERSLEQPKSLPAERVYSML